MVWGKFDDVYPQHRKVRPLTDAAFRLDVSGILWSNHHHTDGHIPVDELGVVSDVKQPSRAVADLIRRGRWHIAPHDCPTCPQRDDGYVIHDFLDYNPAAEHIRQVREARAKAGQIGGRKSRPSSNGGRPT